jgi:D-ribose pyranose/furanose isomerase RbsD
MTERRPPSTRLLLAIIAGLVAVVIALTVVVIDTAINRARVAAEQAEYQRIINQLTKQLYWLENPEE